MNGPLPVLTAAVFFGKPFPTEQSNSMDFSSNFRFKYCKPENLMTNDDEGQMEEKTTCIRRGVQFGQCAVLCFFVGVDLYKIFL